MERSVTASGNRLSESSSVLRDSFVGVLPAAGQREETLASSAKDACRSIPLLASRA